MDAKAKVVAWEIVRYDRHDKESREVVLAPITDETVLDDGDEAFTLMRVTDHEAALAELKAQIVVLDRMHDEAITQRDQVLREKLSLLSAMEALAGELDSATRSPDVTVPQYTRLAGMADEFRQLANSAKDST